MALVALAIRLTSTGPVLYHQRRVGQHGRIFIDPQVPLDAPGRRGGDRGRSGRQRAATPA